MTPGPRDVPSETQALAQARRALVRGRLLLAAEAYEAAARARERAGLDGSRHRLRALEFWTAAGAAERGLSAARRLLARARRSSAAELGGIRLARATLWSGMGRHREAARDYDAARALLGRDPEQARAAALGLAESLLRLGETERASRLLTEIFAHARRSRDRRGAATALHRLALFHLWTGDEVEASERFADADREAEALHMRGLRAAISLGSAEALLRLGLPADARTEAERAAALARELGDELAGARAQLLLASCLRAIAQGLEQHAGPGAGSGLRRQALGRARRTRSRFPRTGDGLLAAECRLEEARLLALPMRARAAEIAASVAKDFAGLSLEREALEARLLARARIPDSTEQGGESWEALAEAAERLAALGAARYARFRQARDSGEGDPGTKEALLAALDDFADPEPADPLRSPGDPLTLDGAAVAGALADLSLGEEPEPKSQTLAWTLIERSRAALEESRWARLPASPRLARAAARMSALSRAIREASRRQGGRRAGMLDRLLERARANFLAAKEGAAAPRLSAEPGGPPDLRAGEALVVFAERRGEVHAWVSRARGEIVSHLRLGSEETWRHGARALRQQVAEAAGWPDSVVPETHLRAGRRALEAVAAEWWTPLWPALEGVAEVIVAPDPSLPPLPWAGLSLHAPPVAWPRPRAVWLIGSPATRRPRAWKLPRGGALAVAERSADLPLAEREARGVARILRGEWLVTSALSGADVVPRDALLVRLRRARVWHLAARLHTRGDLPAFSAIDLDGGRLPLWWLGRQRLPLQLAVFPTCEPSEPPPPPVGRVVGQVGPFGARALAPSGAGRSSIPLPDASGSARVLLAAGVERVVVSSWPVEDAARAPLLGSFYAGLARGDSPGVALYLAQRKAHDEGLHAALWAGLAIWGWP